MKKLVSSIIVMMILLAGCTKNKAEDVILPNLKDITVEIEEVKIDKEDVDSRIEQYILDNEIKTKDNNIAYGDLVKIQMVNSKSNFEKKTLSKVKLLEEGMDESTTKIFEKLVEVAVNEEVIVKVKFENDENYGNANVEFRAKVLEKYKSVDDITNQDILNVSKKDNDTSIENNKREKNKGINDITGIKELRAYFEEEIRKEEVENELYIMMDQIIEKIGEKTEGIEYGEKDESEYYDITKTMYQTYGKIQDISMEEYLNRIGVENEDIEYYIQGQAYINYKKDIILSKLAMDNEIVITEEEIENYISGAFDEDLGLSKKEKINMLGGMDRIKQIVLNNKAYDIVIKNITVKFI